MRSTLATLLFAAILGGCSSSHTILLGLHPLAGSGTKQHRIAVIQIPDSLERLVYSATQSGGLCKGHEFDLEMGKGIFQAVKQAGEAVFDSVRITSGPVNVTEGMSVLYSAKIDEIHANADFSATTFSLLIKASAGFLIEVKRLSPTPTKTADVQAFPGIRIDATESGKAQDCHDAVPFLKKAGEAALSQLRDSVVARLSTSY